MIKYISGIFRKIALYALPILALSCGDEKSFEPYTDPKCLTPSHDIALADALPSSPDRSAFCRAYGESMLRNLQACVSRETSFATDCIFGQSNKRSNLEDFVSTCQKNLEAKKGIDNGIDYACAVFHKLGTE